VHRALAKVYEDQGRLGDARREVKAAMAIRQGKETFDPYLALANLAWKERQQQEALTNLRKAMDLLEQSRTGVSGAELERALFFGRHVNVFERMVAWQAELGDVAEAFAAAERARARALLEQLDLQRVDLLSGLGKEQATKLRRQESNSQLYVAYWDKQLKLLADRKDLSSNERQRQQQSLQLQLDRAQQQHLVAYREIRNASKSYRLVVDRERKPISQANLQAWLQQSQSLLLEYVLGHEGSHVFVIGGVDVKPRVDRLTIPPAQAEILRVDPGPLTEDCLRGIVRQGSSLGVVQSLASPEKARQAVPRLAALWQVLVPEAERRLLIGGKFKRLYVVAEGSLSLLPFESLVVESTEPSKYFLDLDIPVAYAPSATVLVNLASKTVASTPRGREPVLSVSDPNYPDDKAELGAGVTRQLGTLARYASRGKRLTKLPFAGQESDRMVAYFQGAGIPCKQLRNREATEANVRTEVVGRRLVHFACHGLADEAWANFFGALALTPGVKADSTPTDDGFLTLSDIYDLNLAGCELAILSACDTNFGPEQRGEGVWALSRGFLAAGARRAVASNWLVDDEAAASLIGRFSRGIATAEKDAVSIDYARLLHDAKKWVRLQEGWQSPYYWAGFVLLGPS
jgi:CHAT domain-containing protein